MGNGRLGVWFVVGEGGGGHDAGAMNTYASIRLWIAVSGEGYVRLSKGGAYSP